MELKGAKLYISIAIILILVYVSFLIFQSYLTALITSAILAYLFYPLNKIINKWVKRESISAGITTLIILLIFIIPVIFTTNLIIKEAVSISQNGNFTSQIIEKVYELLPNQELTTYINISSETITSGIQKAASSVLFNLPKKLLDFLVIIFTTFYLLIYGERLIESIKEMTPLKNKDALFKHIGDTTYSIVNGLFIIAIVQFIISAVALAVLKVHAPLLIGILIGISVFMPLLGPFIILLPLIIVNILEKSYYLAIALLMLWGILTLVEHIIKPKIIGNRSKLNPAIVLIGILGGIELFGFIGIVAGPLVLSVLGIIIKDYSEYLIN